MDTLRINKVIDDILKREGGPTNDPLDRGGLTNYGISRKSNPAAWADGKVTEEEAREIYKSRYIKPFLFLADSNAFELAVDFGVTSGPGLVIQKIQAICGVEVDGIVGEKTREAVNNPFFDLKTALLKERIRMIGRIVQKDPSQLKFINGWLNRSLEFI